jgi:hypothetical protein
MRRPVLLAFLGLAASTLTMLASSPPAAQADACTGHGTETSVIENDPLLWDVDPINDPNTYRVHDGYQWRFDRFSFGDTHGEKCYRQGLYRSDNAYVIPDGASNAGALQLFARRYCNGVEKEKCASGEAMTYRIGRLETRQDAIQTWFMRYSNFQFGIRAKLPGLSAADGARATFWLRNEKGADCSEHKHYAEIDVIEWYSRSDTSETTTHVCDSSTGTALDADWNTVLAFANDPNWTNWHTYRVNKQYRPSDDNYVLTYKVDNVTVATHDCPSTELPISNDRCRWELNDPGWEIILQTAVFANDTGRYQKPSEGTNFPRMAMTISDMWIKPIGNITS